MEEQIEGLKEGDEVPLSDNIEITELHCHECDGYIKFALDKGKNGEHVVICPKCKHEHCRVIKDGVVTGDRWSSRNKGDNSLNVQPSPQPVYYINVSDCNYSTTGWQVVNGSGSDDTVLLHSWGNTESCAYTITNGTYYTFMTGGSTGAY